MPYTSLYYGLADFVASIEEGTTPACSIAEAARGTAVGIATNTAVVQDTEIEVDLSAFS